MKSTASMKHAKHAKPLTMPNARTSHTGDAAHARNAQKVVRLVENMERLARACVYAMRASSVPEIACDGCSKPFHKACLYEWLSALPSTRSSFNRLFGECPYCSRPVTVEAS